MASDSARGAKAGGRSAVGVAVVAGAALIAAGAWWWLRPRSTGEESLRSLPIDSLSAAESRPDADAMVHYVYAARLVDSGAFAAAALPITQAVSSLPPDSPPAFGRRVTALSACVAAGTDDFDTAKERIKKAGPGSPDAYLSLGTGIVAAHEKRLADAAAAFASAARVAPSCSEAWVRLGEAYARGTEPANAVDAFRRAVVLRPNDAALHASFAEALGQAQQIPAAKQEFQTAGRLAQSDAAVQVRVGLGRALLARSEADYADADAEMRRLLGIYPGDPRLHGGAAGLHLRFGRYDAARAELEEVTGLQPTLSSGWYLLSVAAERAGRPQEAAAALAKCRLWADLAAEVTDLERRAQLASATGDTFSRLSKALFRVGRRQEAFDALEHASVLKPHDAAIAAELKIARAQLHSDTPTEPQAPSEELSR